MGNGRKVAYFTMEIAIETGMPTYSGGLGVLAGDTLRAAADLKVPMVAVTLLHRKGYFYQKLDAKGWQHEEPVDWVVEDYLEELPQRASTVLEGRVIQLRSWKYDMSGIGGYHILPRHGPSGKFRVGPHADPSPLRRRPILPALPGGGSRYRRHKNAACPRL